MKLIPDRPCPGSPTSAPSIGDQDGGDKLATGAIPKLQLRNKSLGIGTWNVRTLNADGKLHQLQHELKNYTWDIIGISEARLVGSGELTTDEGHKLYFSGHNKYHREGTAILVNKSTASAVMEFLPISSRLISLRISAKPFNITIMEVYAPTSESSDQDIEEFYETIALNIAKVPKQDILLIVGDLNAKIGVDAHKDWSGTVGKFGLGNTNDRGLRLLEFAKYYDLVIANTFQPQKLSRKATWHSPDGKTHNLIDYIMISKRHMTSLNLAKTRTFPGADIGSDHDLVLTSLKSRLKRLPRKNQSKIKYDVQKLEETSILSAFKAEIGGRFGPLINSDIDEDELIEQTTNHLKEAASLILG